MVKALNIYRINFLINGKPDTVKLAAHKGSEAREALLSWFLNVNIISVRRRLHAKIYRKRHN